MMDISHASQTGGKIVQPSGSSWVTTQQSAAKFEALGVGRVSAINGSAVAVDVAQSIETDGDGSHPFRLIWVNEQEFLADQQAFGASSAGAIDVSTCAIYLGYLVQSGRDTKKPLRSIGFKAQQYTHGAKRLAIHDASIVRRSAEHFDVANLGETHGKVV
jgi:hypothetical protein